MKCPTVNCPNVIAGNARRKYCANCRASMRYYASKRPKQILETQLRLGKSMFRVEHMMERKADIHDLTEARKERKAKMLPVKAAPVPRKGARQWQPTAQ